MALDQTQVRALDRLRLDLKQVTAALATVNEDLLRSAPLPTWYSYLRQPSATL